MKIKAKDGHDYIYEKHGKRWRTRVRINSLLPTEAPVNGDVAVEPSGVGISVSVALLDDKDEVAVDAFGRYRIFPAHVATIQKESFEKVDPEKVIEDAIQSQIDAANAQLEGKNRLYAVLDKHIN